MLLDHPCTFSREVLADLVDAQRRMRGSVADGTRRLARHHLLGAVGAHALHPSTSARQQRARGVRSRAAGRAHQVAARDERGFVKGTQLPFPADGPDCKYSALFDPRPAFDNLRESFLLHGDAGAI